MNINNKKQIGFSLIELMLVLGIISLAFIGVVSYLARTAEQAKAESAGEQFAEIGRALGNYISRESGNLNSCIATGATINNIPLTVLTTATGVTTVGTCTLNNRLLLTANTPNRNLFGTGYNIGIRKNASNVIGGLVLSDAAVLDPGSATATPVIRYDLLGVAMKKAGASGGMTFPSTGANSLRGLGGGWSLENTDFASINTLGLFGYRVNYQGTYDDIYLRLDGAYPMQGNLNMGNYNVNNATDINFNGWLNGNNALLNNLKTGYISNSGNIQTNTLTATRSVTTGGREANAIPATARWLNSDGTQGDNVHTWNIYSENMIATGSAGQIQASLDSDGIVKANNIRLTTTECDDITGLPKPGATVGLTTAQLALVTGQCNGLRKYSGLLTDRLPQYVSQGATLLSVGPAPTYTMPIVQKPLCAAAGGLSAAKIIVTPQIQNIYSSTDWSQLQLTYNTVTAQYGLRKPAGVTVQPEQIQVYANHSNAAGVVLNPPSGTATKAEMEANPYWKVFIKSMNTGTLIPGARVLAETYCDFGPLPL